MMGAMTSRVLNSAPPSVLDEHLRAVSESLIGWLAL